MVGGRVISRIRKRGGYTSPGRGSCGGDSYRTTLRSWKYTTPAFLVPFMFVLDPLGLNLLLQGSFKALA
jgi:hypothetical protein